jgi:hypothetical protein
MFNTEILRMAREGFTTGGIALHLGLSTQYVRQVVSADVFGREVKPAYVETTAPSPQPTKRARRVAAVKVNRHWTAEKKRAEALRLLAEANAELAK